MISEKDKFSLVPNVSAFLQIREALGMSRKQFGEILGINEDTVGLWERGKSTPALNIAQIKRLDIYLQKLELTWQDLPDYVGDPSVPPPKYKRTRQQLK